MFYLLVTVVAVVAARGMPTTANDLRPVGPLSAAVSQSYADLDAVQDHILAAQAAESQEMDRVLGPAKPSSFAEVEPVLDFSKGLDFSKLDSIQGKLSALHEKMGGELLKLKQVTSGDEDAAQKASADAALAASELAGPSSFMQTSEAKDLAKDMALAKMVGQLKEMRDLFEPVRKRILDPNVTAPATYDESQMFRLNSMNNQVVKLLLHLVSAVHKKEPAEQRAAVEALHKGMAGVRLQMMQQRDEIIAHKKNKPLAPINERLHAAIDQATAPLKERLAAMMESDPANAAQYDVPAAQQKLEHLREIAFQSADTIGTAANRAAAAKTPEESAEIEAGLKHELDTARENLRAAFGEVKHFAQAMALMPPEGGVPVAYEAHTKAVRERMARAIQRRPEIKNSDAVHAMLTHTAAIDRLSEGYAKIMQLIPQLAKDAPDEEQKTAAMKQLRSVLGSVKMEADRHARELARIGPEIDRLAGTDVTESLVQTEQHKETTAAHAKEPTAADWVPKFAPNMIPNEQADEAGYKHIEHDLEQMQSHLTNQVASLTQEAARQKNDQVQQLDAMMTPQMAPAEVVPMALAEKKAVAIDAVASLRGALPVNATV